MLEVHEYPGGSGYGDGSGIVEPVQTNSWEQSVDGRKRSFVEAVGGTDGHSGENNAADEHSTTTTKRACDNKSPPADGVANGASKQATKCAAKKKNCVGTGSKADACGSNDCRHNGRLQEPELFSNDPEEQRRFIQVIDEVVNGIHAKNSNGMP